ncbi:hypothetical protein JKF63_06835 [Porcisia hertigi]|uniref:Uncharacterized protein n=1 Tax=Porcisia hertigi TaxID=2761500 RepID=A0A836LJ70_9TRYP|nr:hypothetical protein JKF63_06835 [Porcisia hertigi]
MVRIGAKRERPCALILHVALRAAALPAAEISQCGRDGDRTSSTSRPERFIWKTPATAEVYADAVMRTMREYWQLLGGVRYAVSDALTLTSAIWEDTKSSASGAKAAAAAAAARTEASDEGDSPSASPPTSVRPIGVMRGKNQELRRQRVSLTERRSGVLRCVVHLSRSVYGDAGAVNLLRAACACVLQTTVTVPVAQLVFDDSAATTTASQDRARSQRRGRTEEVVGDVMKQTCHAAVRVARVEHVLPSRQRR